MNLRTHRLFHQLATSLVLTGCTIERIDLGGIDTIGGEVTAVTSTSAATTSASSSSSSTSTEPVETTCLAYKDDGESKVIPCSEIANALADGYCVLQNIELPDQPTICPVLPTPVGETVPVIGTTTTYETCTYIVEDGTTIGTACGTPASTTTDDGCTYVIENGTTALVGCDTTTTPAVTCTRVTDAGEVVPVPCDDTSTAPTCGIVDEEGNTTTYPCGGDVTTTANCGGTGTTGDVSTTCPAVTGTATSTSTATAAPTSEEVIDVPPDETDIAVDSTAEVTDEPELVDAGAAPVEADAATL
jgi:hypothetical protein